jgi:rSAM/selenodomain-associated transferase 1
MPTPADALAVMAKAAVPGLVKTRLVPPLTHEQAAALYGALLADQLEHLKGIDGVARYLAYTPNDAAAMMRELGGDAYAYIAQSGDDLGHRMNQLCVDLWHLGHRNVVLIGSDLPVLPWQIFIDAFTQLSSEEHKVVLGPSRDGGYYLIGMNQPTPALFANMTWGHDRVLAETTARLRRLGVSFALLPSWFDIDTLDDIQRLRSLDDLALRHRMPTTFAYLAELSGAGGLKGSG